MDGKFYNVSIHLKSGVRLTVGFGREDVDALFDEFHSLAWRHRYRGWFFRPSPTFGRLSDEFGFIIKFEEVSCLFLEGLIDEGGSDG